MDVQGRRGFVSSVSGGGPVVGRGRGLDLGKEES